MSENPEKQLYACMICGKTLVYGDHATEQLCQYCHEGHVSPISCPDGHFVCDSCHSADAIELLQRMAEGETSIDPREIVESAFNHPSFSFHGPEHHSLVPAAILISLKNRRIPRRDGTYVTEEMILEGIRRGSKIPGGFCGYAGNCGACVGAGIAIAVFLGSTPKRVEERFLAHKATVKALELAQDSLVRCCKRSTYYGLTASIRFLRDELNIDLGDIPSARSCTNWRKNKDCARQDCKFYPHSRD